MMRLNYVDVDANIEEHIMKTICSDSDVKIKIVNFWNIIVDKDEKIGRKILTDNVPSLPDLVNIFSYKDIVTLYIELMRRMNARPLGFDEGVFERMCHVNLGDNMIAANDVRDLHEYHQRKKYYYEMLVHLDLMLANYTVCISDVPYIMNTLNMTDGEKLRFMVIGCVHDRYTSGIEKPLERSKVEKLFYELIEALQGCGCGRDDDLYVTSGYTAALTIVSKWLLLNAGEEENK